MICAKAAKPVDAAISAGTLFLTNAALCLFVCLFVATELTGIGI